MAPSAPHEAAARNPRLVDAEHDAAEKRHAEDRAARDDRIALLEARAARAESECARLDDNLRGVLTLKALRAPEKPDAAFALALVREYEQRVHRAKRIMPLPEPFAPRIALWAMADWMPRLAICLARSSAGGIVGVSA